MDFAIKLKRAMDKKDMSSTELSLLSGVGKSNISQYRSGKNIPNVRIQELLAEALDCSFEDKEIQGEAPFIFSTKAIPTRQAARVMHMSEKRLHEQLQKNEIPIGRAYISEGSSKWSYYISPKLFYELTGWRE